MNKIHSSGFLLMAMGLLTTMASAQVDTSQWSCSTCPYPKGSVAAVTVGLGAVSDDSLNFGDWRGLPRKRAHLVLGGELSYRNAGGTYADLMADDLGLDTRRVAAQSGREGLYSLDFGFASIPRHFAEGARTPFLGSGGANLTLPPGFPAATSGAMPLATTLRDADLGFDWRRAELGGSWLALPNWNFSVKLRRDVRDGTRPFNASFFATAAQLPAPVDHVSDQIELAASYTDRRMQGSLAYVFSQFSNDASALRWANPFAPVTPGATTGQIALAPDNQQHQLLGSGAYTVNDWLRASGDFAVGRLTQNAAFLPSTITPSITSAALPAASLDGKVDTFHSSVRLSATPIVSLRLVGVYTRDVRLNDTAVRSYPQVATDLFVTTGPRSNMPADQWQDRVKLSADWRGPATLRLALGADWDQRERSYAEAVRTRETTLWLRASVQPIDMLSLGVKLAGSERKHSSYGVATWLTTPEHPLLRKYNLAERQRETAGLRADITLSEKVSIGLTLDHARDDYGGSLVGLTSARSTSASLDAAWAISEHTKVYAFAQGERIRSVQSGSQLLPGSDWAARTSDRFELLGLGVKHAAIPDKLDIGADLTVSRSRSSINVQTVLLEPAFPTDKTTQDSLKLFATYKLSEPMSIQGSYWFEKLDARDWRLDGVQAATVPNLLTLGHAAPRYEVHVLRLAMRYRF